MTLRLFLAGTIVLASALGQTPFVPPSFEVPQLHKTTSYKLVPLGPEIVKQDYDAYMSSIEHLQKTFSNGRWPTKELNMTDAMKDMEGEAARFRERKSFAYGVLTLDGSKELGSVYVRPSRKQGYDAVVTMWVTKEQFDKGFEKTLLADVKAWMASSWPF
ncbi:MAG TPA: hypothetical protein VEQ63_05045, partial [Bryobacteraceae bacterium]|nr:hypothetical protein [Bryobacteraceae bacterium]